MKVLYIPVCFGIGLLLWQEILSENCFAEQSASQQAKDVSLPDLKTLLALKKEKTKDWLWGDAASGSLLEAEGTVLFEDRFKNFDNWHHEGRGELEQPEPGVMQLSCLGSGQGKQGNMAFCRVDFPDEIRLDYDAKVLATGGLFITFIASQGRLGEDMITDLPKREGVFPDYIENDRLRSYHLSLSRYNDKGRHTGVSNWRRNPGLFMIGQQDDPCREPNRWYRISIIKRGPLLQLGVDGKFVGGFVDREEIPEPIPSGGKIGFRTIGSKVFLQIKNLKVTAIK